MDDTNVKTRANDDAFARNQGRSNQDNDNSPMPVSEKCQHVSVPGTDAAHSTVSAAEKDDPESQFCSSGASRLNLHKDEQQQFEDYADLEIEASRPTTSAKMGRFHASDLDRRSDADCGSWQGQFLTLKTRVAHLYNNELMSDVTFLVGKIPAQRFYAHKFILAIGSSVFDVMFFGTMAGQQRTSKEVCPVALSARAPEKLASLNRIANAGGEHMPACAAYTQREEIVIDDVEPAAFDILLRLLYTDHVEITHHFVMSTLYLAKKYAVPELEKHCVEFLQTNLAPDNAFLLLTQARLFDERQLMRQCLESIDKRTVESLDADCFLDIDINTLCVVLERDSLQVREAKLFSAILQWAQHECQRQHLPPTSDNQRRVLGRAIQLLRFPIMTLEEFANGPAQSGILTDAELVKLFLYFTVNPKPDVPFLDIPRNCYTGKEHVVSRFQRIDRRWGYSSAADCIRMSVSRPIFIVGLGLFGSATNAADYSVTMEIIMLSKQRKLAEHKTTFFSDGSQTPQRVLFRKPVGLQADQQYLLSVNMKGPDSFYGTGGQPTINQDCGKEGRVQFNFYYSHGTNNGTSVEDGQFPEIIFYLCGPNSFSASECDKNSVSCDGKSGLYATSFCGQKATNNSVAGRSSSAFGASSRDGSWSNNTASALNLAPNGLLSDAGHGLIF